MLKYHIGYNSGNFWVCTKFIFKLYQSKRGVYSGYITKAFYTTSLYFKQTY